MSGITAEEIQVLSKYIYNISGIHLDQSKDYLLETRLKSLLISYGLENFSELYYRAKSQKNGELEKKIIDAISTNETLFFRDSVPFEVFKYRIIPELIDSREKNQSGKIPLRIWSAACSTGQEVYSIAISLIEILPNLNNYEIDILGTDISEDAIAKASYGKYNAFEIERGLPKNLLQKYFNLAGNGWRIKDYIRSMAMFKKVNLMENFSGLGKFDVIFCRNVAIYFSQEDKIRLFKRLYNVLEADGYLLVGGSESLTGVAPQFETKKYLRGVYYQPKRVKQVKKEEPARKPAPLQTENKQSRPEGSLNQIQPRKPGEQETKKQPPRQPQKKKEPQKKPQPGPEPVQEEEKVQERPQAPSHKPQSYLQRVQAQPQKRGESSLLGKISQQKQKSSGSYLDKVRNNTSTKTSLLNKLNSSKAKAKN